MMMPIYILSTCFESPPYGSNTLNMRSKKNPGSPGVPKKKDHAPEKDEAALSHSQKLASAELLPP